MCRVHKQSQPTNMQACLLVALVLLLVILMGGGALGGARACMRCARGVPYKAYGAGPRVARMLPRNAPPGLAQAVRQGHPGRADYRSDNVHVSVVTNKAIVESTYQGDTYRQLLRALPGWARRRARKTPTKPDGSGSLSGRRRNINYTLRVAAPKADKSGRRWSFDLKFGQTQSSDQRT